VRDGVVEWEGHRTWYRVDGSLDGRPVPLVALHGGPGVPHDYLEPLADLAAREGRAVVVYDQLGCGESDHLPDRGADFWTVDLFLRELDAVLDHLGIAGTSHLTHVEAPAEFRRLVERVLASDDRPVAFGRSPVRRNPS
jgi:L-proline amide hydrolase